MPMSVEGWKDMSGIFYRTIQRDGTISMSVKGWAVEKQYTGFSETILGAFDRTID